MMMIEVGSQVRLDIAHPGYSLALRKIGWGGRVEKIERRASGAVAVIVDEDNRRAAVPVRELTLIAAF